MYFSQIRYVVFSSLTEWEGIDPPLPALPRANNLVESDLEPLPLLTDLEEWMLKCQGIF